MTRSEAINVLKLLTDAIVETVKDSAPHGAPGGIMYAALLQHGISLEYFEQIMLALVDAGKITKRGDLYFPGVK